MEQWHKQSRYVRPIAHVSSICYLLALLFAVLHQQKWIQAIINKYFSISIQTILLFFSSKNWMEELEERMNKTITEFTILFGVELLFFVIGLIIISFFFFRLKKIDQWHIGEKIVLLGYVGLLLSIGVILVKMGNEAYQTYSITEQRISSMSVADIRLFQEKLLAIAQQSTFSLDQFVPALLEAMEKLRTLVQTTKKIAEIPDLVQSSWSYLLVLKDWLVGLSVSMVMVVVIGHLTAGIQWILSSEFIQKKRRQSKKVRQIDLDERLVSVLEQQEQLLAQLTRQAEVMEIYEQKDLIKNDDPPKVKKENHVEASSE